MNTLRILKLLLIWFFILIAIVGFFAAMNDYENKSRICAKTHGGEINRGYCIYIQDGNSKSINIRDIELSHKEEKVNKNE